MAPILTLHDVPPSAWALSEAIGAAEDRLTVERAASVAEAEELLRSAPVAAAVVAGESARWDAVSAVRNLRRLDPSLKVIVLDVADAQVPAVMCEGATVCIGPAASVKEIVDTVLQVVDDEELQTPASTEVREPLTDGGIILTYREQQVLSLIAAGQSNSRMARQLILSEDTVAAHVARLFRKLGVHDRAGAVAMGIRHGLSPHRRT